MGPPAQTLLLVFILPSAPVLGACGWLWRPLTWIIHPEIGHMLMPAPEVFKVFAFHGNCVRVCLRPRPWVNMATKLAEHYPMIIKLDIQAQSIKRACA